MNSFNAFVDDLMGNDVVELNSVATAAPHKRPTPKAAPLRRAPKPRVDPVAAFEEQEPGLYGFLRDAGSWSDFAASLADQIARKGTLSERQMQSARSMQAKMAAREAAKAAAPKAAATVNLDPIREMFETAFASGRKRPVYRAEGLAISRAPDHGRNPGALYIKSIDSDEYQGKILGVEFTGTRNTAPETQTALHAIAANPTEAAVRYGRKTGCCSFCARELTDKRSVEVGYGPICAEHWGMPWG